MDTATRKRMPQKRIAGSVGEKTSVPELSDLSHIVDIRTHPLFTGAELLPTAPVIELFKIVKRAVLLHETSVCMSAASGAGKTSAIEIVQALMAQSYVIWFHLNIHLTKMNLGPFLIRKNLALQLVKSPTTQ